MRRRLKKSKPYLTFSPQTFSNAVYRVVNYKETPGEHAGTQGSMRSLNCDLFFQKKNQ